MQQVNLQNSTELPSPALHKFCQIDSDGAIISHAGLIHVFKLPVIGEYMYDFKIASNTIIKNQFNHSSFHPITSGIQNHIIDRIPMSISNSLAPSNHGIQLMQTINPVNPHHGSSYEVDCILNYLESVSLCIDSPEGVLSQVSNIPTVNHIHSDLSHVLGMDLNFLPDLPLINGALHNSDIYLVFKFHQKPPLKYYVGYEVGLIADEVIVNQLQKFMILIPGSITTGNNTVRHYNFKYDKGKLNLIPI